MIRSELIDIIDARNPHLYRRDTERLIDTVLDYIASAPDRREHTELRGLGAFLVRHRPVRSARNPKTGEAVFVEDKWVPFFRPAKEITDRLNDAGEPVVEDVRIGDCD